MDTPQNIQESYFSIYAEGMASDHPDIEGQPEFKKKAEEILAKRRRSREEANNPNAKRAKKAAEFFSKSVIRKEDLDVFEETMTSADKKREAALKNKYDDSGMKASMIKQYGPEKGKSVYFATIRKQAMKEALDEIGEEYKELPVKRMLQQAGRHKFFGGWVQGEYEGNRRNASKKKPGVKRMVDLANKRADKIHNTVISHNPEEAKSKSKLKEDFSLDEAKLSRTEKRRIRQEKQKGKSKGAVHAFDVDETLFSHGKKGKPNVKVHVKDKEGKRVQSLSNQEFNTHKLQPGHSYDFGEFRSAEKFSQTASPNKKMIKKVQKLQKRGKNVHLVTARDKFDKPEEFRKHFSRHGMNIPTGNIHYTGGMRGGDIGKKKVDVAKGIAKMSGSKSIHMYDDAAKVHKAFEGEKKKSSATKIKTHLAKPNKRGEVMSRSYQATKTEEFELWVNALIDEGYDLSGFTVDDLIEAYVGLLSEATTAVAAPAGEPGRRRPVKKGPKSIDINYKSPYKVKKQYPKEEVEVTPYDYWKSFIQEDNIETEVVSEDVGTEVAEKKEMTAYDYWKSYITEKE